MKRIDGRIKYTKQAIRNNLLKLIRIMPIEKITVKALCEKSEINRATFYRHYNDCYDVMEEIEMEMLDELFKLIEKRNQEDIFLIMAENIKEHREIYTSVSSDNGDPYFSEKIIRLCYKEKREQIKTAFSKLSETQCHWLYEYFAHGCAGILSCWMAGGMKESTENVAEFLSKIITVTLSTQ